MQQTLIKWFMALNTLLIRLSRGRVGGRLGHQQILVLYTTGRKSGKRRAIPIAYLRDGRNFFIVASNWGREKNADWYFNLQADPLAELEVDGRVISTRARDAEDDEYARLWKIATDHNPPYLDYQKMTSRRIPVVVFEPE